MSSFVCFANDPVDDLPSSKDTDLFSKFPICLLAELAIEDGVDVRNFEEFEGINLGRLGTANCGGFIGVDNGLVTGIGFGARGFIRMG